MTKRLKMKVTTVRQQTVVTANESLRLSCPVCEREVEMLSGVRALGILGVDHQTLNRLVAAGQVHSVQTVSRNTWVCKESLFSK